jgi:hypothetical protein
MFQEEITILNIYAQHIGASNNIKKRPTGLNSTDGHQQNNDSGRFQYS